MDIQPHTKPTTTPSGDDTHGLHSNSDHDNAEKQKTPSPKNEKKIIKESGSSAGGTEFSDAVTDFSETGISPDVSKPLYSPKEVKKIDKIEENVMKLPDSDTKHSAPLANDRNGSGKDKLIDQTESSIDEKHVENRSMVDVYEVKPVVENVLESQPSEHKESESTMNMESSTKTVPESNDESGKKAETDHTAEASVKESSSKVTESVVSDKKDKGKVGLFEPLALTGQDFSVDASVGSSSYNSLDGNWGSVSGKSEVSMSYASVGSSSYKSRFGLESGPSVAGPRRGVFEQKASGTEEVNVQKSQPPKLEGGSWNEEAIAKVSNWSTSESKTANPKLLMNVVKKAEEAEKASAYSNTASSTLTRETPQVNEEPSGENTCEGKKNKKKGKGIMSWLPFRCCFSIIRK